MTSSLIAHNDAHACFEVTPEQLFSYVEGELSDAEAEVIEKHLAVCTVCLAELNSQKSFLHVLDDSLARPVVNPLPKGFTRVVMTNAETRVGGLRSRRELLIASLIIFAALGGVAVSTDILAGGIFDNFYEVFEKTFVVFMTVGRTMFHLALGLTIFARSAISAFDPDHAAWPYGLMLVAVLIFFIGYFMRPGRSGNI